MAVEPAMTGRIERVERRWLWWFGVVSILITTVPYIMGFAVQGKDWVYSGLLVAAEDGFSYLAKMMQGSSGDWLFRTPYTAYPQAGFFAFFPYLLLGKLASGNGLAEQLAVLFHLFRVGGVMACVWATYAFMAVYISQIGLRRLGTLMALFGGGLGFLSLAGLSSLWQGVMHMPMEFYSPETFGFLSILALPHLAWARAILLWGLTIYIRRDSLRSAVGVGFLWLVMGLMQPLTIVTAWAVQGAHLLVWAGWTAFRQNNWVDWRRGLLRLIIAGIISAPLVIYNLLAFQLDPFLKRWGAQNLIPSPPPVDYLLSYILVLPLIVMGIWIWRKVANISRLLPLAWCLIFPLLAYAPYNLQRRLPEGIWVNLCLLAVVGLGALSPHWKRIMTIALIPVFFSTLVLYSGGLSATSNIGMPLFRPAAEVQAMDALAKAVPKGSVVLASRDTSTVIPTRACVYVLIGHGPESISARDIEPRVADFFKTQTTDTERRSLLTEYQVQFIFSGPLEKALGDWKPESATYLQEIYSGGDYRIFRVIGAGNE